MIKLFKRIISWFTQPVPRQPITEGKNKGGNGAVKQTEPGAKKPRRRRRYYHKPKQPNQ